MNTKTKSRFKDYAWTGASLATAFLLLGFGTLNYDQQVHQQRIYHARIERIRHIRHARYLHWRKWHLVWDAERDPSRKDLSRLTYLHPEHHPIIYLHHDHSTLDRHAWHYDHAVFSGKDRYGRTSYPATAYLDRLNATGDALRKPQKVRPIGWHQQPDITSDGFDYVLNRGHLLAYSLTKDLDFKGHHVFKPVGNQNDPGNLFTETAFTNQDLQYTFETKVRMALERGKKVIYQARPIFRGHDDMARGIHLQAISTDGKFQFNVYCFNIQPYVEFDYRTGVPSYDSAYTFPIPWKFIDRVQQSDDDDSKMKLQRKVMRLYDHHVITRQQAEYDEGIIVGGHWERNHRK